VKKETRGADLAKVLFYDGLVRMERGQDQGPASSHVLFVTEHHNGKQKKEGKIVGTTPQKPAKPQNQQRRSTRTRTYLPFKDGVDLGEAEGKNGNTLKGGVWAPAQNGGFEKDFEKGVLLSLARRRGERDRRKGK